MCLWEYSDVGQIMLLQYLGPYGLILVTPGISIYGYTLHRYLKSDVVVQYMGPYEHVTSWNLHIWVYKGTSGLTPVLFIFCCQVWHHRLPSHIWPGNLYLGIDDSSWHHRNWNLYKRTLSALHSPQIKPAHQSILSFSNTITLQWHPHWKWPRCMTAPCLASCRMWET